MISLVISGPYKHFDVSGILETWKYHGHRFVDKTKPHDPFPL